MTQIVSNYAKVLYDMGIEPALVQETKRRYLLTKELQRAFLNPVIPKKAKHNMIDRIFDPKVNHFLKVMCDYDSMGFLPQVLDEYYKVYQKENDILAASLYYVTEPSKKQLEQMMYYLAKKFHKSKVQIKMKQRQELVGGFILRVGDCEMDWSLRGRFKRLEQNLNRR